MSLFIDKQNRRKSPIALAAFGAALLDLFIFGTLYALLSEPLYRLVSLESTAATTMVHALAVAIPGTLLGCLLFFLPDKRVTPYGFAGLAVALGMFYVAASSMDEPVRNQMLHVISLFGLGPVLLGNAVAWPVYLKIRRTHGAPDHRKTVQEELREAVKEAAAEKPAPAAPAPTAPETPAPAAPAPAAPAEKEAAAGENAISPEEALFGPEAAAAPPTAFRSAQEEAALFYVDDEENDD